MTGLEMLIIALVLTCGVLLAFFGIAIYTREKEVPRIMPLVERLQYDKWAQEAMHPALVGATDISSEAIALDVLNDSLETGQEHPLLTARKREALKELPRLSQNYYNPNPNHGG